MKQLLVLLILSLPCIIEAQDRPNILWLTVEDISDHLGAYGYMDAKTPNLDAFAKEGVLYNKAYTAAPVCAVVRSGLLTGVHSMSQGTQHMRNNANFGKDIKPYPTYLREAGYYCSNATKTDYQGLGTSWNSSKIDYDIRPDKTKPFMQVINTTITHESKGGGSQSTFDPAALTSLPPYYPDTKKSRAVWAKYYANITLMDIWVGEQLARLKKSGEEENTIVVYYSDHGVGLPRGKRWAYDSGLKVPWIVRVPAKYQYMIPHSPGTKTDEIVSSIDLVPTLLKTVGLPIPEYLHGRAFMGDSTLSTQRKYIHGHRDRMDERYDIIRTVRDQRYRYIRNYEYFKPHQQFNDFPENNSWSGIMEEIRRVNSAPNPPPEISWFFEFKTVEELYDIKTDKHEMKNLAHDPLHRTKLLELRAEHLRFRKDVRDLGAIPEGIILKRRSGYTGEYDYGKAKPDELERAWHVLDSLPHYTAAQFISLLSDKDEAVRYWAATGLGNLGDKSSAATTALSKSLEDGSPWVEVAAARGLLLLGSSADAFSKLKSSLKHSDQTVKLAAILVIDEMGSQAKPILGDFKGLTDSWKYITRVATQAVASIEDPPRIPPLLKKGCPLAGDKNYQAVRDVEDINLCLTPVTPWLDHGVHHSIQIEKNENTLIINPLTEDYSSISILRVNGRTLYKGKLSPLNKTYIPTKTFPTGTYIIKAESKNGLPSLHLKWNNF